MSYAASTINLPVTSLSLAEDNSSFYKGISDMLSTCNTMINMQEASINAIKNLQEKYTKSSIVMSNEKFDALMKHVGALEERINDWTATPT